jgi:hypothetical protein
LVCRNSNGQVAALDTLVVPDEVLTASRPRVRTAALPPQQEGNRKPESTTRGVGAVAPFDMDAVEAFEDALRFEFATRQVRGSRQAIEILDRERGCFIGAHQRLVGVTPCAALVTLPAVFKTIHLNHARAD